jgi:hypothetical protein
MQLQNKQCSSPTDLSPSDRKLHVFGMWGQVGMWERKRKKRKRRCDVFASRQVFGYWHARIDGYYRNRASICERSLLQVQMEREHGRIPGFQERILQQRARVRKHTSYDFSATQAQRQACLILLTQDFAKLTLPCEVHALGGAYGTKLSPTQTPDRSINP